MNKTSIRKNLITFIIICPLFFIFTFLTNKYLLVFTVSSVRISAAFNPVLGIVFGIPAILACAVGNFISDLVSGWGLITALLGFPAQLIYGFLPYYLWRKLIRSKSHITRLDSPKKVGYYFTITLLNCIVIAINVAFIQYVADKRDVFTTFLFVLLNDMTSCVFFGLPFFSIYDLIYSKYIHKGKRKLSVNELIILNSGFIEILLMSIIVVIYYVLDSSGDTIAIWTKIFVTYTAIIIIMTIVTFLMMWRYSRKKEEHAGLRIIEKTSGTIFVDEKKSLEFVSFPGQKQEYRVKADSLGFTLENAKANIVPSYEDAWYTLLSNQKGCPMKCSFCDCPAYGFYGNVSLEEAIYQMNTILDNTGSTHTESFRVDFMRMGEPTLNKSLLTFIEFYLREMILKKVDADEIVPYISTVLPKNAPAVKEWLLDYCRIKNEVYNGKAELQFSITTTDEKLRNVLLHNMSLSLKEIAEIGDSLPYPKGNKYRLNFPITKDSIVEADVIAKLFDKDKFAIKLTPIHKTFNALDNGFEVTSEYEDYDVFEPIEKDFEAHGFDVLAFLDKEAEDDDSLTCGHLLLPNIDEKFELVPAKKKNIGLVVAIEMDAVFKMYPDYKELVNKSGFKVYLAEKDNYSLYIVHSGMGESFAAAATQFLISNYNVSKIINFGVAGGIDEDMSKSKVCLVDRVVHYKYDCSEFMNLEVGQVVGYDSIYIKTNENLVKKALSINADLKLATCCSGDKFVSKKEEKEYLHKQFGGNICDMEAAGILLACDKNKIPCIMFKAISDGLYDDADDYYSELEDASLKCLKIADTILDEIADFE